MNSISQRNKLVRYLSSHKLLAYVNNEPLLIRERKTKGLEKIPLKKSIITRKKSKLKRKYCSEIVLTTYSLTPITSRSNMGNVMERNRRALFTPLNRLLHISSTNSKEGTVEVNNKQGVLGQEKSKEKVYFLNRESATVNLSRLRKKSSPQDVHIADRQENISRIVDLLNRAKEMNQKATSVRRGVETKLKKQFRTVGTPIVNEVDVANDEFVAPPDDLLQTSQSSYRDVLYDIFTSVLNRRAKSKLSSNSSNLSIIISDAIGKEKSALQKSFTKLDLLKVDPKQFDSPLSINREKDISKLHGSSVLRPFEKSNMSVISRRNLFPRNTTIKFNQTDKTEDLGNQKYCNYYLKLLKNNRQVETKKDENKKNKDNLQQEGDISTKSEFSPPISSSVSSNSNNEISINYDSHIENYRRKRTANTPNSNPEKFTKSDEASKTCYSASSHQDAFKRFYKKLHPNDFSDSENSNRNISNTLPNGIIHNVVSYTRSQTFQTKNQKSLSATELKKPKKLVKTNVFLKSTTQNTQLKRSKIPIFNTKVFQGKYGINSRNTGGSKPLLTNPTSEVQQAMKRNSSATQTIMKNIKSHVSKTLESSGLSNMTNRLLSNIQNGSSWTSGWWERSNFGSRCSSANEGGSREFSHSMLK